jgi:hypothetical protein
VLRGQYQGSTTATMPRYTRANARYLSIQSCIRFAFSTCSDYAQEKPSPNLSSREPARITQYGAI